MKKLILILVILIPSVGFCQLWGDTKSKDLDDVIFMETDEQGVYIIGPKRPQLVTIDTNESKIIFRYGPGENGKIKTFKYESISQAIRIIEQYYPEYKCIDVTGLVKCKLKEWFKIVE